MANIFTLNNRRCVNPVFATLRFRPAFAALLAGNRVMAGHNDPDKRKMHHSTAKVRVAMPATRPVHHHVDDHEQ